MAGITSDLDKNIQRPPETPRKGSPGGLRTICWLHIVNIKFFYEIVRKK